MISRPILFSTPMVKAILTCAKCGKISINFPCSCGSTDFVKTMTRRVLNEFVLKVIPRRKITGDMIFANTMVNGGQTTPAIMNRCGAVSGKATNGEWLGLKPEEFDFVCPYCDGNTRLISSRTWEIYPTEIQTLWVRETWRETGSAQMQDGSIPEWGTKDQVRYKADDSIDGPWRPSIFMPRWASRIALEVVSVKVERVQDISENDARAEGVAPRWLDVNGKDVNATARPTYRQGFAAIWNSINSKRGYGWDVNPWVWVIEFRRVQS